MAVPVSTGVAPIIGYLVLMTAMVVVVVKSSEIVDAFVRAQRSVRVMPGKLGRRLRAPQQARWYWWLVRMLLVSWAVAVFVVAGLLVLGIMHTD